MKKRILAVLCVSCKKHETEQQSKDLSKWLNSLGYKDDEIEWLERIASNIDYEDIKRLTTDSEIKTIAVWDITGFGRSTSDLLRLKMFFIEHKIQLLIKKQAIKLFNDDGTISIDANMLYNMLAAMAEQKDAR